MKRKISFILSFILLIVAFSVNTYAATFMHTFTDEEWKEIEKTEQLDEKELGRDLDDGPGYDLLKKKYGTDDFQTIVDGEDATYGIVKEDTKEITAPSTVKKAVVANDDYKMTKRDKRIEMQVVAEDKKQEKEDAKADEPERGENKLRIALVVDKDHPNNPTPGATYTKTFILYTDCDTLGDAMREAGLTDDVGFITTIDGINGSVTIENTIFGWKGYSWMLYQNGRLTSVGADDLHIEDGSIVRWKAEFQSMTW